VVDIYTRATNCFDFDGSQRDGAISLAARRGDVNGYTRYVQSTVDHLRAANPDGMIVPFITNHDMDRASGFLTAASGEMQMAANLYILSSGSPFIYYGEEIGLRGSRGGANTDANRRLAMLWGDGDSVRNPVGSTYDKQTPYAVTDLEKMQGSLLHHYRKLIALRKANPEIARGEVTALRFPDTKAGGYLGEWNGSAVGVFHNTTARPVRLNLRQATERELTEISGWVTADPEDGGAALEEGILTLGPQTAAVLR
jgi:glycosidase